MKEPFENVTGPERSIGIAPADERGGSVLPAQHHGLVCLHAGHDPVQGRGALETPRALGAVALPVMSSWNFATRCVACTHETLAAATFTTAP